MTAEQTAPPEVEIIEARADRLDDIESLWRAMHEYHAEVAGEVREVAPFRRAKDSWRRRRGEFERWMRAGDAWLLIAEREGSPVGFAFFRICEGDWSFETSERMGELEALSVEPELRRWGIGSLLMEEVEQRLAAAGVGFIGLAVVAGNEDALRFYKRWGMAPSYVRCLGRTLPGGGP
ncbi:MAG: GNAT family N-acetyltransferase [Solirubrobacterales bacterium]